MADLVGGIDHGPYELGRLKIRTHRRCYKQYVPCDASMFQSVEWALDIGVAIVSRKGASDGCSEFEYWHEE
jgi:hypothetical protein